ncbi:hypothetical protein CapIbe_008073 [Capra ibex]
MRRLPPQAAATVKMPAHSVTHGPSHRRIKEEDVLHQDTIGYNSYLQQKQSTWKPLSSSWNSTRERFRFTAGQR